MIDAFSSRMPSKQGRARWLASSVLAVALLSAAPGVEAGTVPAWNLITAEALRTAKAGSALAQGRVYAMVHGAMFDAVNAIDRRYRPYAVDPQAAPGTSRDAAAAAAAHAVLSELYPTQRAMLDTALAAALAQVANARERADGAALGKAAAESMLALRRNDGMSAKASYTPKTGPGAWRLPGDVDPIGLHWGAVTPFALKSAQNFIFPGPPALTSARYVREFNEVKAMGARKSLDRTAEQTAIAILWEPTGPLAYNAVLRAMPELKQRSIVEQARVFALMNMAGADALIVGWRAKYLIQFWRPETAIRNADADGNDATLADASWEGLRSPFPAHPDYPSGHALFAGVAETVLRDFFGTDRIAVTVTNAEAEITRTFKSFSQMAKSVEDARVWAGIHFRSAVVDGAEMGRRIAAYALQNCMQPIAR